MKAMSKRKRCGAVVVFRQGVTPEQAEDAFRKIADVLETGTTGAVVLPTVHKFDIRDWPVWYIP